MLLKVLNAEIVSHTTSAITTKLERVKSGTYRKLDATFLLPAYSARGAVWRQM